MDLPEVADEKSLGAWGAVYASASHWHDKHAGAGPGGFAAFLGGAVMLACFSGAYGYHQNLVLIGMIAALPTVIGLVVMWKRKKIRDEQLLVMARVGDWFHKHGYLVHGSGNYTMNSVRH